jgi:hypothetical protein
MPDQLDEIQNTINALEAVASRLSEPPAMVVLTPEGDQFLFGNKGGLIRFAITALRAAQGQKQSLSKQPWIVELDGDWGVPGIELNEKTSEYLQAKTSQSQSRGNGVIAMCIFLFLAGLTLTGAATLVDGLWHLISR